MKEITELKAKNIKPGDNPVPHGNVKGLRLEAGSTKGHGKWTIRFVSPVSGKRRDMGLGMYPEVSIAAARVKAEDARRLIANGKDPIHERDATKLVRRAEAKMLTFEEAAEKVHEQQKPGWNNRKHADQWINTLKSYVFPEIGNRKVPELTPADFADVLRPIWLTKAETASRVKQRCHTVMKWCWAQGLVEANPVEVVDHLLPLQPGKRERVQHQPSMPWQDVPEFVGDVLRTKASNVTRNLLEFVILTAARSGEAKEARWNEVDVKAEIWTIPASRMKSKVVHRVPLSTRAV
ncbi:MAG: integrase arm-type DNA-binding domain-containing protein, partial [Aestuariivirga sp.]